MPEDNAKVVGVVLDENGALSQLVIEQEDHTVKEVDVPIPVEPTPGIGDHVSRVNADYSAGDNVTPFLWAGAQGVQRLGESFSVVAGVITALLAGIYTISVNAYFDDISSGTKRFLKYVTQGRNIFVDVPVSAPAGSKTLNLEWTGYIPANTPIHIIPGGPPGDMYEGDVFIEVTHVG